MSHSVEQILTVGIVGAGDIVRKRHLPGLAALKNVAIGAVANRSRKSTEAICAEFSLDAAIYDNWRSLVAQPELDIIWIGTHPNLHPEITLAALEAGKHVFCQARMAPDLAGAESMMQATMSHPELVTMLCPPPYGLRYDGYIRHLLSEQIIGTLHRVNVISRNSGFLDPHAPPHWRQLREANGLNILTLGIHVEILQRWFGDIASVLASGRIWTSERGGRQITTPDDLFVIANFANGELGTLDISATDPGPVREGIEIIGERGRIHYDYLSETITLTNPRGNSEIISVPAAYDRPWRVERDFITAVRNPDAPRPHPTFRDGVAYMRVVQAVHDVLP
jgi:predicted dehydrogenase